MLVLFDTETEQIRDYPRGDELPVEQLDPRYVVLRRVITERPDYDPATKWLRETRIVDLGAGEWRWGWVVEDLPPPVPPGPDYAGFYGGLLSSQVYAGVVATQGKTGDQAAAMVVFLGAVQDALNGRENRQALQQAIWLLLGQLQLGTEGLAELQALLEAHFMAGIYSLAPMPPAETLGQEWTDAAGGLWVVEQARGEDGQFLADDPTTAERESLSWVRQ
ncbi:MAG: hypothetical protein RLZZ32_799 [Cyanobacteriota bacterium]|jgi:hypothetical protein